jgi:polysaccharide export outer membrane protein
VQKLSQKLAMRLLYLIIPALIAGCAMAPGLYMKEHTAGQNGADPAPAGALVPITLDLIRKEQEPAEKSVLAEVQHLFAGVKPYVIGVGDVLSVTAWGHPEISAQPGQAGGEGSGYPVSSQGEIQFPLLGRLKVLGQNEQEVQKAVTEGLARYIKNPQVTVRIQAYRSGRVYIDGEVRIPGLQAINDLPMSLQEALARAGGLTANAKRTAIAITRQNATTQVDLLRLAAQGINPSRIMLAPGDLVFVPTKEEAKVFVMGEVMQPRPVPMRADGRLTLNEALGESGGVSTTGGNAGQIYVLRSARGQEPKIYHLDATRPLAYALSDGFELKPRDVVYVDPVPLVRWNRVISLLLPSGQALQETRALTTN